MPGDWTECLPCCLETLAQLQGSCGELASAPLGGKTQPCHCCVQCLLRLYTLNFRISNQLFCMLLNDSRWGIQTEVGALNCGHHHFGLPISGAAVSIGVKAHSTRGVASSWALAQGAILTDICRAAGWVTPDRLARFYNLCVESVSAWALQGNTI